MKVVKTPISVYVLYALAVLFLCMTTFEIFISYGDIRNLVETQNFVMSEHTVDVISYYIEHCAIYFGIACLLYAAGVITAKLNEVHGMACQIADRT